MRRLAALLFTGLVVLAVAGTVTAITVSSSGGARAAGGSSVGSNTYALASASGSTSKADHDNPAAPAEYADLKDSSAQNVTRAQVLQAEAQAAAAPTSTTTNWTLVGPSNVGGRVVDLVVDPTTTPETLFVATSGGGVWKSTDQGMTFTPAWPSTYTQTLGSIARASDGTLWVGTGEANPSGGGLTFTGTGLYKSTDDGNTWTYVALNDSAAIGRIAVNPNNPNELWVAASGSISDQADYTQTGLYHTTDGGQTWTRSIVPPNSTTGAIDVAVDPSSPNIVWAALWDHKRDNGARVYGGVGSGLYRSTDDGTTWTRLNNTNISGPVCSYDDPQGTVANGRGTLTSGSPTVDITTLTAGTYTVGDRITGTNIPANTLIMGVAVPSGTISATNPIVIAMNANATGTVTTAETITDTGLGTGLNSDPSLGRIGIAIAPSNPNIVYFVSGAPYGPEKGFYSSANGEAASPSFTCGGDAYAASGYQWWFGRLWVDPNNPQHLFNADVNLRTSINGGATWATSSGPHSDQHALEWDPNNSPTCEQTTPATCVIYNGDDGGIYHSTNNGGLSGVTTPGSGTLGTPGWIHGVYEPWNQSYHLGVAQDDNSRLNTGLQDNGSVKTWANAATEPTDLTQWSTSGGGDGHWNLIDPTNHNVYYQCSQNASCSGDQDIATTLVQAVTAGSNTIDVASAAGLVAGTGTSGTSVTIGSGTTADSGKRVSAIGTAGAGPNGGTVVTLTTNLTNSHNVGESLIATISWNIQNNEVSGIMYTTDAPLALDPASAGGPSNGGGTADNVFYVGGSVLGRSTNQGKTMTAVSPVAPNTLPGPIPANEVDLGGEYSNQYGTITAIGPYANTVYVGTDTGLVWKTTNVTAATPTWTQLGTGQNGQSLLPTRWVNAIDVDPTNTNHVIVAFSGYREGYNAANIYESYDGGNTWTNISGNLPNAPVETIRYDQQDGVLYAATDLGLFYLASDNSNANTSNLSWTSLDGGLPNTPILDIQLSGDDRTLFAATFGRSVWDLPLSASVLANPGGTVAGQLALTLSSASPSFGTFAAGVGANYATSITAGVTTTAQNTSLTVADLTGVGIAGHLFNSSGPGYSLASPVQVDGSSSAVGATGTPFTNVSATQTPVVNYSQPVSNDNATIGFNQPIAATDPLRTGSYTTTLSFTLSTATL